MSRSGDSEIYSCIRNLVRFCCHRVCVEFLEIFVDFSLSRILSMGLPGTSTEFLIPGPTGASSSAVMKHYTITSKEVVPLKSRFSAAQKSKPLLGSKPIVGADANTNSFTKKTTTLESSSYFSMVCSFGQQKTYFSEEQLLC